jgi:hypothetical protein
MCPSAFDLTNAASASGSDVSLAPTRLAITDRHIGALNVCIAHLSRRLMACIPTDSRSVGFVFLRSLRKLISPRSTSSWRGGCAASLTPRWRAPNAASTPRMRADQRDTTHGAKAFAVRCRTGVSSGKCRSSSVVMLLALTQSIPGWV